MVLIPSGEFWMGSPDGEGASDEYLRHKVYLDGFYKYEVTVAQYRKFCNAAGRTMPDQPGFFSQNDDPVVNVSWDDANAYCGWAGLRLPSEAVWEKAARGGTETKFWWGNTASTAKTNYSSDGASTVGSFPANPFGLYETAGNVREWCFDWYGEKYYGNSPKDNPEGPGSGQYRVVRGGSWFFDANFTRSANRG